MTPMELGRRVRPCRDWLVKPLNYETLCIPPEYLNKNWVSMQNFSQISFYTVKLNVDVYRFAIYQRTWESGS